MLFEALLDEESLEDFSLERHGYLVVLDDEDNLKDLHEVGLNPEEGGLLGSWPEYYVTLVPPNVAAVLSVPSICHCVCY